MHAHAVPQSPKEILEALRESTSAIRDNTATLRELTSGSPLGVVLGFVLVIAFLTLVYAWSRHLTRTESVRSGRYRMLSGAGALLVFVSLLGVGGVHSLVVRRPDWPTALTNMLVFLPFLLGSVVGYAFDRRAILAAAPDEGSRQECDVALLSWQRASFAGGVTALLSIAAAFVLRFTIADDRTAQTAVLSAVLGTSAALLGYVWFEVRRLGPEAARA